MKTQQKSFGEANFADAQLGDTRRTKRLVQTFNLMCRRPGGSLPQKLRSPKDLRAFYRLMNCPDVTHESILAPHRQQTLNIISQMESTVLILHDATEMDFTSHRSLEGLGQIGNGNHRGYIAQNSLAIDPQTGQTLGLCNQVLHHRVKVPPQESIADKRERASRESLLWLKGTEPLPANWQLVDVCDQGADTFEFLEHETRSGRRFLIRSAYNRGILIGHGDASMAGHSLLRTYATQLPAAGTWSLSVTKKVGVKKPKRKGKKTQSLRSAREAKLAVAFAQVQIKPPATKLGMHGDSPLKVWVIRVWEMDPPAGEERLEWFLLTNEPIKTLADAYRVVSWYERRWIVEELHKGMKTGCRIESPQFESEAALQPTIALLSIVTLTLLEMRDASRGPDAKTRQATEIISREYVQVLSAWRHGQIRLDWTIHDFYYALARLGGHQNRRGDHPPGWQTIWEGWKELQAMVAGVEIMNSIKICGKT